MSALRFKLHLKAAAILYRFTEGNNSDLCAKIASVPQSIHSGCYDLLPPALAASNHMLLLSIPYSSYPLLMNKS
jgi:hypothetical protein